MPKLCVLCLCEGNELAVTAHAMHLANLFLAKINKSQGSPKPDKYHSTTKKQKHQGYPKARTSPTLIAKLANPSFYSP